MAPPPYARHVQEGVVTVDAAEIETSDEFGHDITRTEAYLVDPGQRHDAEAVCYLILIPKAITIHSTTYGLSQRIDR